MGQNESNLVFYSINLHSRRCIIRYMGEFKVDVYKIVSEIPEGKVMTYGQIAALCGHPGAARTVGQIAHFGPDNLPWQRVVMQSGGLAGGYYGGMVGHKKDLEEEGIIVNKSFRIKLKDYIYWPE